MASEVKFDTSATHKFFITLAILSLTENMPCQEYTCSKKQFQSSGTTFLSVTGVIVFGGKKDDQAKNYCVPYSKNKLRKHSI